jgi:precorrin-3B C17-methyltransferase
MSRLFVVGIGPGAEHMQTPQAAQALAAADDLVGYGPYVARIPERPQQRRHVSDNREELARARHALELASQGRTVAVVSGGDAGVFAMASAVFEAIESGDEAWRSLDVEVVPGISAMFAVAARLGAPLGNDFCALSLSDNLKPWEVVLSRLVAAARAGFVIALYNPWSRARPWQLGAALASLREILPGQTPVVFADSVSRAEERIMIVDLAHAAEQTANMRTLVLIGAPATRRIDRVGGASWLYTPRWVESGSGVTEESGCHA